MLTKKQVWIIIYSVHVVAGVKVLRSLYPFTYVPQLVKSLLLNNLVPEKGNPFGWNLSILAILGSCLPPLARTYTKISTIDSFYLNNWKYYNVTLYYCLICKIWSRHNVTMSSSSSGSLFFLVGIEGYLFWPNNRSYAVKTSMRSHESKQSMVSLFNPA